MTYDSSTAALIAHWRHQRDLHFRAVTASSMGSGILFSPPAVQTLASAASPPPEIAMGVALIEIAGPADEGQLIRAVTPAWVQILKELEHEPGILLRLTPRQFEELLAGAYAEEGWSVTLTPRSGDGGVDIIATRDDVGAIRVLDQAKLYSPGHVVAASAVREMWAVLDRDRKASKAIITTTSTFAPGVYEEFKDSMPTRLDVRNGEQVRAWLTRVYAGS